jgi:hypothetical protein
MEVFMSKIISFNDFSKNKAKSADTDGRLDAIKGSLNRINALMNDLKQLANTNKQFEEIAAKNKENQERLEKERKTANNKLKHSLKLDWQSKK